MGDFKYTYADLKKMQAWKLTKKIQVTQTRILEWYERNEGRVHISFSGGKDSTVLLDLARRIYPDIPAIFVDTGLEYPEIKEFVKTQRNVEILRPKMSFNAVINKYGYPVISKAQAYYIEQCRSTKSEALINLRLNGKSYSISKKWQYLINAPFKISAKCCDVMKKIPMMDYEKRNKSVGITGEMAAESRLRLNNYMRNGCNMFDTVRPKSTPLAFWTEQDVLKYIKDYHVPYCKSVYGDIIEDNNGELITTANKRTGCVFCMFGVHMEKMPNRFQLMEKSHPKIYLYCMEHLGLRDVLTYINVPYKMQK